MHTSRIVISPHTLHGKPRIRGTRIAVSHVLELLASGVTPTDICARWYPDLRLADVQACIAFANEVLSGEEIHVASSARR